MLIIWDPGNAQASLRYAITWFVRDTGHLPKQVTIPGTIELEQAAAQALAAETKAIGVAIHVDGKALGIACQGQGKAAKLHQLPWPPLYNH